MLFAGSFCRLGYIVRWQGSPKKHDKSPCADNDGTMAKAKPIKTEKLEPIMHGTSTFLDTTRPVIATTILQVNNVM